MASYSLGNMAIRLAGDRYLMRFRKVCAEAEEAGETDLNHLLATTYLHGVLDMAALYIKVMDDEGMADCLREMDGRLEDFLSGRVDE